MYKSIKLFWYKLLLKGIQREIDGNEKWQLGVTTKDPEYLIIDAKCELTELRAARLRLTHTITKLEG